MTAGLPGTHRGGSTLHRRILAAIVAISIAAVPAHAHTGVSLVMDTTPVSAEFDFATESITVASEASTDSEPATPAPEPAPAPSREANAGDQPSLPPIDQVIYKGVVGNILEAMPLDPEQRVSLQRGNAVVNNTFTGRTLAVLLGIASSPLMIVGLIWGIWAAVNIKAPQGDPPSAVPPPLQIQAEQRADSVQAPDASSADEAASDSSHVAAQGGE